MTGSRELLQVWKMTVRLLKSQVLYCVECVHLSISLGDDDMYSIPRCVFSVIHNEQINLHQSFHSLTENTLYHTDENNHGLMNINLQIIIYTFIAHLHTMIEYVHYIESTLYNL
jgi:hypothetical protein